MRRLLAKPMKIASFNINNINLRLTNLLNWLREAEPDIVCLQEIKAADTEFPAQAIRQAGYHAACGGERRWNGVAILARCDLHELARRRHRSAMPLSRGGGQRRARRLDLRSQWQPPAPVPNSITSSLAQALEHAGSVTMAVEQLRSPEQNIPTKGRCRTGEIAIVINFVRSRRSCEDSWTSPPCQHSLEHREAAPSKG